MGDTRALPGALLNIYRDLDALLMTLRRTFLLVPFRSFPSLSAAPSAAPPSLPHVAIPACPVPFLSSCFILCLPRLSSPTSPRLPFPFCSSGFFSLLFITTSSSGLPPPPKCSPSVSFVKLGLFHVYRSKTNLLNAEKNRNFLPIHRGKEASQSISLKGSKQYILLYMLIKREECKPTLPLQPLKGVTWSEERHTHH